jgi:hypothetical protein
VGVPALRIARQPAAAIDYLVSIRLTVGGAFKVATAARIATIREEMAIISKATSLIAILQRPD